MTPRRWKARANYDRMASLIDLTQSIQGKGRFQRQSSANATTQLDLLKYMQD